MSCQKKIAKMIKYQEVNIVKHIGQIKVVYVNIKLINIIVKNVKDLICIHNKQKYRCLDCKGSGICEYKENNKEPTIDDIIKRLHYTNLQPMWAKENLSKGNKFIGKKF